MTKEQLRRPPRPPVPPRRDPRRRRSTATTRRTSARRGLGRVPVHDGAPPGARRLDPEAHRRRRARPLELPDDTPFNEVLAGLGQRRRCRPRWPSPACCATCAATTQIGPAGRADHPRRGPHVRHGRAVPRAQDLRRAGPEVRAGRPRPAAVVHRVGRTARSSRRASPRPARWRASSPPAPATPPAACRWCPFYIFYSMFGFQRVGDLIWQAADARARGFLLGATAGRTTLLGEGLQHQDGHSLVLASTVPPCQAYDPAFAYEIGAIVQARPRADVRADSPDADGRLLLPHALQRELPDAGAARARRRGRRRASCAGLYRWPTAPHGPSKRATVLFSGIGARCGPRRRGRAGRALRRRRRAVVGHVVQGAARRGARRRALEPPAPDAGAARRRS